MAQAQTEATSNGTGRRKEAVVRVRLVPGEGQYRLNGRTLEDYFPRLTHRSQVLAPLRVAGLVDDERSHRAEPTRRAGRGACRTSN